MVLHCEFQEAFQSRGRVMRLLSCIAGLTDMKTFTLEHLLEQDGTS